ncbi:hypothetical protein ALISP_6303 [Alicycliphilus sp. B1]|nr:hypothetical protein ALISP_6303 [Alicycliphilus sp. B1]
MPRTLVRPTVCPPKESDESVLGHCWKASIATGSKRIKGLADYLVERRTLQPPWIVPCNLRQLYERLAPVFSSPDEILKNHTCMPALMPFVRPKHVTALLDHLLDGKHVRGIASVVGFSGRNIESRPVMALCLECVKADRARGGVAYWHREHQLPGLGYCPQHGIPLVAGCGVCQFSHPNNRKPKLPQELCWCGQPHALSHPEVSKEDGAVLTRMARMAVRLLRGALAGAGPESIGAYYHEQARKRGYSKQTYIASEKLSRDVQNAYSPQVLARLNATLGKGRNWLSVCMGQRLAPIILGRNLLLLDFFGRKIPNRLQQRHALAYQRSLECRRDELRKPRRQDYDEGRRDEVREALLAFKQDWPDAGRTKLLQELGRVAIWARENDSAWYEEAFPSRKRGRSEQSEEVKAAMRRELDERASEHVFSHQLRLLSAKGQPKKLTKTLLLKGTPRGNELSWEALKSLPLTAQAVELCVETTARYKRRYAVWLLDNLPADEDLWQTVRDRTGLPLPAISRLANRPGSRRHA